MKGEQREIIIYYYLEHKISKKKKVKKNFGNRTKYFVYSQSFVYSFLRSKKFEFYFHGQKNALKNVSEIYQTISFFIIFYKIIKFEFNIDDNCK